MGFSLAYVAWRYGETPAGRSYTGLLVATGVWCTSYVFVLTSPSFQVALALWPFVVGVVHVVTIQWLRFTVAYTGYGDRFSRTMWALLWFEAAVYTALAFTNSYHGLLFTDVAPASFGSLTLVHATIDVGRVGTGRYRLRDYADRLSSVAQLLRTDAFAISATGRCHL